MLERRLDNVVYNLGLASSVLNQTIYFHNHILVNGKKLNIVSINKIGDIITLDKLIIQKFGEITLISDKDFKAPRWLDLDKKNLKLRSLPIYKGRYQYWYRYNLIIEYYSR